jgi:hypothetical protein
MKMQTPSRKFDKYDVVEYLLVAAQAAIVGLAAVAVLYIVITPTQLDLALAAGKPAPVQQTREQLYPNLVVHTPAVEPEQLKFYSMNNAFVARTEDTEGAKVTVRNHKGQTASANFTPRADRRLHGWGWFENQDALVPNPGEITTHPYTVIIERDGVRIARFRLDPLRVTNAFGASFYAHIHGEEDSFRPALELSGVAEYGTGRTINKY